MKLNPRKRRTRGSLLERYNLIMMDVCVCLLQKYSTGVTNFRIKKKVQKEFENIHKESIP